MFAKAFLKPEYLSHPVSYFGRQRPLASGLFWAFYAARVFIAFAVISESNPYLKKVAKLNPH